MTSVMVVVPEQLVDGAVAEHVVGDDLHEQLRARRR